MSTPPPASPPAGGGDPSMEDILASIRRILSEDEAPAGTGAPPTPATPEDDVLILDASMRIDAPGLTPMADETQPEAKPAMPEPADAEHLPAAEAATPTIPAEALTPPPAAPDMFLELPGVTPVLVAPEAAALAAASVGSMVRGITAERGMLVHSGGPTVEDLVRAELRPLLKHWLDTNLPPLVERLVRAELERVIGRAVP